MVFDDIDKKLLEYLQSDSKQTNKELSNKLNLSVTAVYERIKKLEKDGFINLSKGNVMTINGLDGYALPSLKQRIDYQRPIK